MKRFLSKISAMVVSACMFMPTLLESDLMSSDSFVIAAETKASDILFDNTDQFFVYVGTYHKSVPQFRYLHPASDGGYTADKVIWEDAPAEIAYGDIFIASGEAPMTRVYPAADDPANAHVYFYTLDDGAELHKAGNCSDIMEKKDLSVTSKTYDGSSHWSVRYTDIAGEKYYYGLSTYASSLAVDPLDCEINDIYTFAMYNDYLVIPLAKQTEIITAAMTVEVVEVNDTTLLVKPADRPDSNERLTLSVNYLDSGVRPSVGMKLEVTYTGGILETFPEQFGNVKKVSVISDDTASGDVNDDGEFNAADVVLLQKWLLNVPDTVLKNWKAADFCSDGELNVFDLGLMKKELIRKTVTAYVKPDHEILYGTDLYVIADVPMYLGPDTSYSTVTTIPSNTVLTELGVQKNNQNWAFTAYEGQYGWVQMVTNDGLKPIIVNYPMADKPVIYLYPENETDVHVELALTEADLSTTYPKYHNGWDVTAYPDGTLLNKADGTHHRYLFWDAVNYRTRFDFSKGFCVAGSDTERFLKEKLTYMGLTEEEMNEFIVYWLPRMEHNAYNLISFQGDAYTDSAKLNITPAPDSMLRIFMTYVPLENAVDIEPQELSAFERKGFTVVEWGGSEIK